MIVKASMYASASGAVREIDVPDAELVGTVEEKLERVFRWGQNDFQPRPCPSLSVGDVVCLDGRDFLVRSFGWRELTESELLRHAARCLR